LTAGLLLPPHRGSGHSQDVRNDSKVPTADSHALLKDGSDPYEGLEVTGWPELTMVRGRCIINDGKLLGTKGFGEFIRREVRA
jgi:dihydropyrimidinase